MISSHTGAAPVIPLTFHIGSPEKFPAQTPTVQSREYPTHQLSRMSLLVPVFTEVQKGVARAFSSPKVALRLSRSASMCDTRNAAASEYTRRSSPVVSPGVRRRRLHRPLLASVR